MSDRDKWQLTRLADGGRRSEWRGKLVNPPVERASTILFDTVADLRSGRPGLGTYRYGLQGTATHWALAEALTELEPGAAGTTLYPSGLAAITGALMAILSAGDELLVTDSAYDPTRIFCDSILKRWGISTLYYDPLIGAGIAELFTDRTRAILLECPGSMTMEVQDVPAICKAARKRGIATLLDNTWATPLFFPAIAAGVDIAILAATKYVGGHSDVMIGAVTATEPFHRRIQETSWDIGFALSPDDAWLGSRGLRTMAVRLKQHEQAALQIAQWLSRQPQVEAVLHPALPDCPGHDIWKRDFRGASGLFSFALRGGGRAARDAFVDRLQRFGIGYSWGGYESLVLPVDPHRTVSKPPFDHLVRLQIGLEEPEDLIADLTQALAQHPTG
jgi:cystathionine beta-lyase